VARLRRDRVAPTRPSQPGSNDAIQVERWKAVGNLLGGLALIPDELEHLTISRFHGTTVLLIADEADRRDVSWFGFSRLVRLGTFGDSAEVAES
jgi:hypothetical protein